MKTANQNFEVTITNQKGQKSRGWISVRSWDKKERLKRSLKFWAACWGLAVVSVVVPLAHFFLVPGFFLAGPIGAWILHRQVSVILGGEGSCPGCGVTLPIARSPERWPLDDLCSKCHTSVVIERA